MALDETVKAALGDMASAALAVLGSHGNEAKDFLEEEMEKIGKRVVLIEKKVLAGDLTAEEGRILLKAQVNAAEGTLAIFGGISALVAEKAVHAALDVLYKAIGTALPFKV